MLLAQQPPLFLRPDLAPPRFPSSTSDLVLVLARSVLLLLCSSGISIFLLLISFSLVSRRSVLILGPICASSVLQRSACFQAHNPSMHGDALKMQSDQELANISTEEEVKEYLKRYIDEERWEKVVKMYYTVPQAHTSIVDDEGFTALHLAIYFRKEDVVRELLNAIIITNTTVESSSTSPQRLRALEIEDNFSDTPLNLAARFGLTKICQLIIGENDERIYLLSSKNKEGETPLFDSVTLGQKQTFAYLPSKITGDHVTSQHHFVLDKYGRSILHVAIDFEHFDLALVILHCYDFLRTLTSREGLKPLDVLARKPSAFRSGSSLSWWSRILYHWIVVEPVDPEREMKSYLREMEQYGVDPAEMKNNHFPKFCSRLLSTTAASFGSRFWTCKASRMN